MKDKPEEAKPEGQGKSLVTSRTSARRATRAKSRVTRERGKPCFQCTIEKVMPVDFRGWEKGRRRDAFSLPKSLRWRTKAQDLTTACVGHMDPNNANTTPGLASQPTTLALQGHELTPEHSPGPLHDLVLQWT